MTLTSRAGSGQKARSLIATSHLCITSLVTYLIIRAWHSSLKNRQETRIYLILSLQTTQPLSVRLLSSPASLTTTAQLLTCTPKSLRGGSCQRGKSPSTTRPNGNSSVTTWSVQERTSCLRKIPYLWMRCGFSSQMVLKQEQQNSYHTKPQRKEPTYLGLRQNSSLSTIDGID